jgi:hypothetical protein
MAHRLVANAFLPNPNEKATVDHLNRQVDDNRLSNLRWATIHEQNANKRPSNRSSTPVGLYADDVLIKAYESLADLLKDNGYQPRSIKLGKLKTRADVISGYVIKRLDHDAYDDEEWRPIQYPNTIFLHDYKVSNKGRIWLQRGPSKGYKGSHDYMNVDLYVAGDKKRVVFRVHRLVAAVFLASSKPLNELVVNHKDGDRGNNDVDNLEWCTQQENASHSVNVLNIHLLRQVACYDQNTRVLVEVYPSISKACLASGANPTSIRSATRTKGLASGFFWRYIDQDTPPTPILEENECKKSVCKIAAYDPSSGILVNVYEHIKAAAEANSIFASGLRNQFGRSKPYAGYLWRKCPFEIPNKIEV